VLFAGEVFPVKYLKLLKSLWQHPRYFNLYGATETTVCTFYKVPARIPESQLEPVPIGKACPYCKSLVVNEADVEVVREAAGELCITGLSVMQGYWNLPENTAKAFLAGRNDRRYRTGDTVTELPDGNYKFLGRRDRMIMSWERSEWRSRTSEWQWCFCSIRRRFFHANSTLKWARRTDRLHSTRRLPLFHENRNGLLGNA
jgi:non-ribosomal peptide synthetase component F